MLNRLADASCADCIKDDAGNIIGWTFSLSSLREFALKLIARPHQQLTETQIMELLPDYQNGWSMVDYGMWVARAVERAHGITVAP